MKKKDIRIYVILCILLISVAVLAIMNRGDAELRRALEENREFHIRVDGETVAVVGLQTLLDLEPQEFVTTFATSVSRPRETALRGVELRILLDALDIDTVDAAFYLATGLDGYYSRLSAEEVARAETVYICYMMDAEILKPQSEGGYGPFLLAIRGERFALRWCKYLEAVDIST